MTNSIGTSMWSRVFRLRGTVILHIWWQVTLVVLFTTGIIFIHLNKFPIHFPMPILIDIMGVVTGLLLAFRTQTSYERFVTIFTVGSTVPHYVLKYLIIIYEYFMTQLCRYSQGSELWCQMTIYSRNLTRLIWTGVTPHDSQNIVEKKSAINLVLAFAVATKHYLREEYGYKYADLSNLLSHITTTHATPRNVSISHKETFDDVITTQRDVNCTNIPLEISYYIASYIKYCQNQPWDQPKCDAIVITAMHKCIQLN